MELTLPAVAFQPYLAPFHAARLRDAITWIQEYGVSVHAQSAPVEAVTLLEAIGRTETFAPNGYTVEQVERALTLSHQFPFIGAALPSSDIPGLTPTVERAVRGNLRLNSARQWQAISELFVGALLAAGGCTPHVPPASARHPSPDFVADVDGVSFSVEVKRPEKFGKVIKRLRAASRQAAAYSQRPGIIVLDVTDVLQEGFGTAGPVPEAVSQASVARLADLCGNSVVNSISASDPGFMHTAAVVVVAQRIEWLGPGPSNPKYSYHWAEQHLRQAYAGLVQSAAENLCVRMRRGLEEFGAHPRIILRR